MKALAFRHCSGRFTRLAQAVSVAAAVLVAVLVWLTANPEAHEYFHPDADHQDHRCVVTAYAAGEGFQLQLAILVEPRVRVEWARTIESVVMAPERTHYALLPICGPPSAA